MTKSKNPPLSGRFNIGQDWASVVTGFVLIVFVVLTGYAIATPSFGGKAGWDGDHDFSGMLGATSLWTSALYTFVIFGLIAVIGMVLSGEKLKKYLTGFLSLFLLAILAQFISSYAGFKNLGLETVLFSLLLGLILGNAFRLPEWLRSGVQTELYVKIGLVLLGFGLSPLVTAPLARMLVEQYGVARTFLVLGIVFGMLLPMLSMPFKYPESEGAEGGGSSGVSAGARDVTSAEMMKSANFKGLYLNFIIGTMIGLMMIGLTSSIGTELIGMAQKDVVLFISIFAVFNGIGRPVFGWLTDRLSAKTAMLLSYAQIITAAGLMLSAKNGSIGLFAVAFAIFWFNVGGWLAIAPTATNNMYGPKHYSQNYGIVFTAYGIGAVLGVSSSGLLLDAFQNYDYIFYLVIASCLMGSLLTLMLLTGNKRYKNEAATEKRLPDLAGRNSSQ